MRDPDLPEYSYARRGRQAVDPAIKRMALVAGGISVAVILVALVWSGMRPGSSFGPVPVIQPPPGALRILPASPGGLTVPGANEQIMSGDSSAAPAQLAPSDAGPDLSQLDQAVSGKTSAAPAGAAVPMPPMLPPAAASIGHGPVDVQLAATTDEAGAQQVWANLIAKMPEVLQGRNPVFVPAKVHGNHIWRLRLGGFVDVPAAKMFCDTVVKNGGTCTVAAF